MDRLRTIRFGAWMNEELGASGSITYGKEHASEYENHIAVMESDLGSDHPTGLLLSSSDLKLYLAPVAEALKPIGAGTLTIVEGNPSKDLAPMFADGEPSLAPT